MNELKIASNLKIVREDLGLTQQDLAKKIHTSAATICQIESGARIPSIQLCIAIADVFGLSLDEMVGRQFQDFPDKWREMKKYFSLSSKNQDLIDKLINALSEKK